ncbi:hypothetical protein LZ009_11870 [Ramlibacter sp. XY19]|uniref:hypothetical protein n=1 Tax=Ramlibacter paludis TaxID=2908000 RepID=UPI0023DAF161|nr:hypothetical protein [Ramlibacter paludis]MCG2593474.1 hypothetical protein [Ramlibacter paludis]
MSDFSPQEQSFALMPAMPVDMMPLLDAPPVLELPASTDVQPHEVTFRQLRGHEIGRILHLREEIRLPAAARSDGSFATREKKETRTASSVPSCATANTSARSACCQ